MSNMISDLEVKNFFFEMEKDNELLTYTIKNYPIYFLLRFDIEQQFRSQNFLRNKKVTGLVNIKMHIVGLKNFAKFYFSTFFKSIEPEIEPVVSDYLFVSTSDWTSNEGESIELVDIIQHFKNLQQKINFVQPDFNDNSIVKQSYHDNFLKIFTRRRARLTVFEIIIVLRFFRKINQKLGSTLGNNFWHLLDRLSYSFSMADQLYKILLATKAKVIFARSIYTESWLLIASRMACASCVEVQHGVVGPHHIYYQTSDTIYSDFVKKLMPDYILTMGAEWRQILINQKSFFNENNTFDLGVAKIGTDSKQDEKCKDFIVLICLQPGLFSINEFLESFFRKYTAQIIEDNFFFVIRPHPNSSFYSYSFLEEIIPINIKLDDPRKVTLLARLNECSALLSPASMCLYEAIANGIPSATLEVFKGFVVEKGLVFITGVDDFWEFLQKIRNGTFKHEKVAYLSPLDTSVLNIFFNDGNNY